MGCIQSVPKAQNADGTPASTSTKKRGKNGNKPDFDNVGESITTGETKVSLIMREKRENARRRGDIFAESVSMATPVAAIKVPKAPEVSRLIKESLAHNFLFCTIADPDLDDMVALMQDKSTQVGDIVIQEGSKGDYFYVVETGTFSITVKDANVGQVQTGATFGELALVYNCPRRATITCTQAGRLWALDRVTFRQFVAKNEADQLSQCRDALRNVSLLKPLTEQQLSKLGEAAQIVSFVKGERIINKGERGNVLYIIKSGAVVCSDAGDSKTMSALRLAQGEYFGERALLTHEPRAANVTAETDVTLVALDREALEDLLGSLREVIDRNMSLRVLQSIPMLRNLSSLEREQLFLALQPVTFKDREFVIKEGESGTTFFIIKSGSALVRKSLENGIKKQIATLTSGNYFGEMSLLHGEPRQADVVANGVLECLSLDRAKFIELLGPVQDVLSREADQRQQALTKAVEIDFTDLQVLRTLGTGTFGRVKLVRHKATGTPYAMKVLRKATVVAYKQQTNVLNEKAIMALCHHPFILKLHQTYKDKNHLYLLVEFVQGGELFSYLHLTPTSPGRLGDHHARFYASNVLLAMEYLHDRTIVYRDLKPENVLIDPQGYLKIVDFGFAKVVDDRTYTLCGTPEYLAPEIVLGTGHNKGVDYWALGVLIYEMVVGYSPFAGSNQADQMQICRNIVREKPQFPAWVTEACRDLILKLLERDQAKRLGLTHGGARAIRSHAWFASTNWDAIYAKSEPAPYRPALANPFDTSKFDPVPDDDDLGQPYEDDGSAWDAEF